MNAERSRRKIGLALSGGAARGLAHIGVLEVLRQAGIPIDIVTGTSAGAVVGAIYAATLDLSRAKKAAQEIKWVSMIDPSLPRSGLIKGKKIIDLVGEYIGKNTLFSDLKIPFACTATDIENGKEVIIDRGPVLEALRASISIPAIFTPVKKDDRYLVDGGLTTPVPIKIARRMGADFVIAVYVTPDFTARTKQAIREKDEPLKEPNVFRVIMQTMYITTYAVARLSLDEADCIIEPDLTYFSGADFHKAHDIIARGEEAARKALLEITRKLERP